MAEKLRRLEIPYFDGVNSFVSSNISKKQEFWHAENARSKDVGSIEKREGTRRLGNSITSTANYGIFYFENDGNNGFYRISTVGGVTGVYYLNGSAVWTALSGFGTSIYELGSSTSQFDITNPGTTTFRYTWDGTGTDPNVNHHVTIGTTIVINAQNFAAGNKGTFTVTAAGVNYFEVTNAAGVVESNKTIGTGTITVTGGIFDTVIAEGKLFFVNGDNDNMYINSDGTTVVTSQTATGNMYNCPDAHKINYYKDRLYVADYTYGSYRYKNSVLMSSLPVGLVSLVDGDHSTGVTKINVTDTKYIHYVDSLDVYRGNTFIETLTVSNKTEYALTVTATVNALNSSDELWVSGTFSGERVYRWVENPASGTNAKKYDSFKLAGDQNDRIKMLTNIADVMVIGNNNNLSFWNNSSLQGLDMGIGCVSDRGYIKNNGSLYFIHYSGVYSLSGAAVPKLISSKVEKYILGATRSGLESAAAGKKGYSVFFAIGAVTLYNPDGSIDRQLTDVVLEYNMRQENWFVHTGIDADQFETYHKTDEVDRLEYSSTNGAKQIFELFNGTMDDHVTTDKEIPMRVYTSDITLAQNFENICYPQKIIIESERGSNVNCFISLDNGIFYELFGDVVKGCTILNVTNKDKDQESPPRCRRLRLSLQDFSKQLCKITRVAIIYNETDENEQIKEENYER
jgi:hypothetical protein